MDRLKRTLELGVLMAALASVPVVLFQEMQGNSELLAAFDWCIWVVFVSEFAVLLYTADDRWKHVRQNWLDLAVIVLSFPAFPDVLALVRVVRVARVVRVVRAVRIVRLLVVAARGLRALRRVLGRASVVYLAAVTLVLIVAGGWALSEIEPATVQNGGIWGGIWWAIVTVSTVGYGDIAPVTFWGRAVSVLLIVTGIGLVSTISASIAAHFVEEDDEANVAAVNRRLDRIEALLRRLVEGPGTDGKPMGEATEMVER